ncbi:MAG: hypothetical protein PUB51_02910, partial [Oscillospiraceae bacterium]|nr:hypothetical protein [Oscillospiraceae bacterium]
MKKLLVRLMAMILLAAMLAGMALAAVSPSAENGSTPAPEETTQADPGETPEEPADPMETEDPEASADPGDISDLGDPTEPEQPEEPADPEQYVLRVGLRYGSDAMDGANLANSVGSGFTFGYY